MSQVIVYSSATSVVVVNPAPGIDPTAILATVVPSGVTGFVIDQASLPATDRETWVLDATGTITSVTLPWTAAQINAERDRRLYGGLVYNGVVYQSGTVDIANITGACQLAFMAIVAGAKAGDYRWADPARDFEWISADNTFHPLDAQSMVLFAKQAAAFRNQIIIAARLVKNALTAGQTVDIYADATWGQDSTSPTSTAATDPSGSQGASQTASSGSGTTTASSTSTAAQGASTGS